MKPRIPGLRPRLSVLRPVLSVLLVCGAAAAMSGCQGLPTGPSLKDIAIEGISKRPTLNGDTSLCCCHVIGTATNRNSVPVYVTITFNGVGVDGRTISKILYFIPDLNPGATKPIDAAGFVVPCDAIGAITWEVKATGLTYPPL